MNVETSTYHRLLSLVALLGSWIVVAENAPTTPLTTINVTSDDWCPYICPDTWRDKGLIIEVVTAALREVGLKTEYQYTKSWKRAIQNVETGFSDILLDADNEHSEILDFAENFYVLDESVFVILKGRNITLNYPKDLWRYKLGVIKEYIYDKKYGQWEKYITEHPNVLKTSESLGESHLLELLARKRIDIVLLNWDVARHELDESQIKQFSIIEKGVSSLLHLGFTRSERGRKIKEKFEQGFNRLIDTKKLKNIYAKYHIKMPDFSVTD